MSSVRSLLSYTESATFTRLSPPRCVPLRNIVGCASSIGPLALAASSAASSFAAPSPSAPSPSAPTSPYALTVGSVRSGVGSSGRSPSEKLSIYIIEAGVLWILGFGQRPQCAGHQFILLEPVGDVETNYRDSCWNFLT